MTCTKTQRYQKIRWNLCMTNIFCVNLSKLVKMSFYTIFDYTYFWVSFKVDGPDPSLCKISHLMGQLKFKIPETTMFLKLIGIDWSPILSLSKEKLSMWICVFHHLLNKLQNNAFYVCCIISHRSSRIRNSLTLVEGREYCPTRSLFPVFHHRVVLFYFFVHFGEFASLVRGDNS